MGQPMTNEEIVIAFAKIAWPIQFTERSTIMQVELTHDHAGGPVMVSRGTPMMAAEGEVEQDLLEPFFIGRIALGYSEKLDILVFEIVKGVDPRWN